MRDSRLRDAERGGMALPSKGAPREGKDPARSFRYSSSPYMQSSPSSVQSSPSHTPSAPLLSSTPPPGSSPSLSPSQRNTPRPSTLLRQSDLPPVPLSAPANPETRNSAAKLATQTPPSRDQGRTQSPTLRIRLGDKAQADQKRRESASTENGKTAEPTERDSREPPRRFVARTSSLVPTLTATPPSTPPVNAATSSPHSQFAFWPSTPTSVLDRPRPVTPDPSTDHAWSSPSRSDEAANLTPRSVDLPRPPNSAHSSARSIPRYLNPPEIVVPPLSDQLPDARLNQSTGSSRSNLSAPGFGSMLDRPRPRTPDTSSFYDASSRPSTSYSTHSTRSIPANPNPVFPPRPSLTTSLSSSSSMTYESASSGVGRTNTSGATLLSLDLGIDESSVFDLDSFLSVGASPVKKEQRPIPARLDLSGTGASGVNTPERTDVSRWRETVSSGTTNGESEEDESKTPSATTFPDDARDLTPLQKSKSPPSNIPLASTSTQTFVFPSPVGTLESDASFEPLPLEPRPSATSLTRSSRRESYSNASPHRHSTSSSTTSHYYDSLSSADPSPVKRSSIDKSLPPTPSIAAPLRPLGLSNVFDPPPASTKPSVIRRGLSKMMNPQGSSVPSTRSSSSDGHQSGFQVISATSTKRTPVLPRPRDTSSSSVKSNSSDAGKRFADRFAASDRANTATEREEVSARPKAPRRKSTLSGLLSGSESLGMSLLGARKSETLLKSETRDSESSGTGEGRRSFELHIQKPPPAARRASTDNLLVSPLVYHSRNDIYIARLQDIASARLTEFHHREAADLFPPISAASIQTFAPLDPTEKASFATATRVTRPEPTTPTRVSTKSQNGSPGFVGRNTATPVLVRGESLLRDDSPKGASPGWRKRVKVPDSGVGSDCSLSSVWIDLEDALVSYVLPL